MKNSDARPCLDQDHAARNASNAQTSRNWMTTSALLKARSTKSVKYCRALSPATQNVSKRVSVQGRCAFLFRSIFLRPLHFDTIPLLSLTFADKTTSPLSLRVKTVTVAFRV